MIPSPSSRISSSAEARRLRAVVLVALLSAVPSSAASPRSRDLLLTHPYPIVAYASFSGGLFQWLDSLAGTTAGKTVPAHREDYVRRFGRLGTEDERHLRAFVEARSAHYERLREQPWVEGTAPRRSVMLGIFCGSATVGEALAAVRPDLAPEAFAGLEAALRWFTPKYEQVWDGGAVPKAFLERVRRDPQLAKLEKLLERMVRFYDVSPEALPPPRIALTPVPEGYGTHAEAMGGVLLLEIRPGENLVDEACVVAHESAHYLWGLVPAERKARLNAFAAGLDASAGHAWTLFGEAVPTALGQGVVDRAFRPDAWSMDDPWYHTTDVDRCAKRIFPTVRLALDAGQTYDEAFLLRAFEALRWDRGITPRSP